MTFILLTGAGFSYNWGGPLASDVFSALLADKDNDPLIYAQEYLAEFVDWSGVAFFSTEKLLEQGQIPRVVKLRRRSRSPQ